MAFKIIGLEDFPKEAEIIGRLVVGYGELEFELLSVLTEVLESMTTATKVLFRGRGEEYRIQIADALMRNRFAAAKLLGPYQECIADLGYCRQIRNQYAHAHFDGMSRDHLTFVHLERAAKRNSDDLLVHRRPLTLDLLDDQETYFMFVQNCLTFLRCEYVLRTKGGDAHGLVLPTKIQRPPLDNGQP